MIVHTERHDGHRRGAADGLFVYRVERQPGVSVGLGTAAADPKAAAAITRVAGTSLRVWFFTLAFVCIGLEFQPKAIREAGRRPLLVFGAATILNMVLALVLATWLFTGFTLA